MSIVGWALPTTNQNQLMMGGAHPTELSIQYVPVLVAIILLMKTIWMGVAVVELIMITEVVK